MAILWAESFDYFGTDENKMLDGLWAELTGGFPSNTPPALSTSRARTGTTSLFFASMPGGLTNSTCYARRVFGGAKTVVGVAMAAYLTDLPTGNGTLCIGQFRDAANTEQVSLYVDSTGIISAYRGDADNTKLGDSGTPAIVAAAWNHIEVKVKIDNSTGYIEVRVNEVTVLNLTGKDTAFTANIETSQWAVGKPYNSLERATPSWWVDDLVAWDDQVVGTNDVVDFIGDKKVFTALPNADTAEADFQKSTGSSGYQLIDETTPNDADYIFTATDGDVSEFGLTDLPSNAAEVIAVIPVPRLLKSDAGTVTHAADLVHSGSATAAADIPATTQATYWPFVHTKNPSTGVPWTPAEFNATLLRLTRAVP